MFLNHLDLKTLMIFGSGDRVLLRVKKDLHLGLIDNIFANSSYSSLI